MPKSVLDVRVRVLTEDTGYGRPGTPILDLKDYLYQNPPTGLPRLIEPDYVRPEFRKWADEQLEVEGFDPAATDLRYASIDVRLEPLDPAGPQLSFPFMINSVFTYHGLVIHGPFVAGHQAGLSMVQTRKEPKYARFYLPPRFDDAFTSDHQTAVIAGSIHGIITSPGVDGLVAALPDRGRDPNSFGSSNIARLLTGGHIADVAHGIPYGTYWSGNPLRGLPYKLTPSVFDGREAPLYAEDFTYYSFLRSDLHKALIRDRDFLRLTDLVRRLGPLFKATCSEHSAGLLFNPTRNMQFITELLDRSTGGRAC